MVGGGDLPFEEGAFVVGGGGGQLLVQGEHVLHECGYAFVLALLCLVVEVKNWNWQLNEVHGFVFVVAALFC